MKKNKKINIKMSINSIQKTLDTSPNVNYIKIKIQDEYYLLIKSISKLLEEIINKNKKKRHKCYKDCFYSEKIPSLTIYEYISSIVKYTGINESTLILSIVSITSLMNKTKNTISYNNIYKLIITSVFLNVKFNEDFNFSSKLYAYVGRIPNEELNFLEYQYYSLCDYSLFVKSNIYEEYYCFFQNKAKNMKL